MTNKENDFGLVPVVSEIASVQMGNNKYTFKLLDKKLNKIEIKKYFLKKYNLKPLQVNVINRVGKKVRRGKSTGMTPSRKFAVVTFSGADNLDSIKELF